MDKKEWLQGVYNLRNCTYKLPDASADELVILIEKAEGILEGYSDHGFASENMKVGLNNLLENHGYLPLPDPFSISNYNTKADFRSLLKNHRDWLNIFMNMWIFQED